MCGRFTQMMSWAELHALYALTPAPEKDLRPRFNVSPGQTVLCIRPDGQGGREPCWLFWGFIPRWWKADAKGGRKPINARGETVASTPMFRASFRDRRCIVPANGFFEWPERTHPNYIAAVDRSAIAFAGVWDRWTTPDGTPFESFAIVTCAANAFMNEIHDRMPVMLNSAQQDVWLNPHATPEALLELLQPRDWPGMQRHAVSTVVNSPKNDKPDCILPI